MDDSCYSTTTTDFIDSFSSLASSDQGTKGTVMDDACTLAALVLADEKKVGVCSVFPKRLEEAKNDTKRIHSSTTTSTKQSPHTYDLEDKGKCRMKSQHAGSSRQRMRRTPNVDSWPSDKSITTKKETSEEACRRGRNWDFVTGR